jgi:hypothetical protein
VARLYIQRKHDMGMADWPDDAIIAQVTDITATLIVLAKMTRANDDWDWLLRHRWFLAACGRLFDNGDAAPLNG